LLFDVKGLLHPPDRVVAYLRYYPDTRGTRLRDGIRYAKVYELQKRALLLRKRWPRYIYYDKMQGRELQGVPKDAIARYHVPQIRLRSLLHARKKDRLETSAASLIRALADESKLSLATFGISGSLLVDLHRRGSDIDVVAYGTEAAKRVQRTLFALLEMDKEFHRYSRRDLKRLYTRRDLRHAITFSDFESHEKRKVFQGRFLHQDYFLRCVKDWQEISERYGESHYMPLGTCTVSARVVDDSERLLTPCRYSLDKTRVLQGSVRYRPREVVSFRGRFAEQAYTGERIMARGRLELVQSKVQKYLRLVVGEDPSDVLRTIR
jgi:predicted nucleotidyltransferase